MSLLPRRSGVVAFAAFAIGAGLFLGFAGWPQPHRTFEFSGLILAAILTSALSMPSVTKDWPTMPPSFVIDFISLLFLGPSAALLCVGVRLITERLTDSHRTRSVRQVLVNAAAEILAIQAAGLAHKSLGGTLGQFAWPQQGVPIAAAVLGYCFVKSASAEVIEPFFMKRPIKQSWPQSLVRDCPNYFIGAAVAVGLVELIDRR